MTQLTAIQLDDDTVIYVETTEDLKNTTISSESPTEDEEEEGLTGKGANPEKLRQQIIQHYQGIEKTIRNYTIIALNAFKTKAIPDVNKVTLEFGIELGGEAGIPYVSKGTAKSNLKITVECSLPKETANSVMANTNLIETSRSS